MFEYLNEKTILVTGGTGSFGKRCVETILKMSKARKLIIFSRDELKQYEMSQTFNSDNFDTKISYYIGDVRDAQRLHRAFHGVDIVIHAAALKQVPAAEYNPDEAVKTNVMGAVNIINAAIDQRVKKVIALSTDKAVSPINLYGATKLCAEKLFVAGNNYVGDAGTRFSVTRYGNVLGSRGSVIPVFLKDRKNGVIKITDERMTRFWMTLEQSVHLVLNSLKSMVGGEIFIPQIPSMKITDLAAAIAPECRINFSGIRPGEKINECLISEAEARNTIKYNGFYVILPEQLYIDYSKWRKEGTAVPEYFAYTSDKNESWLTTEDLKGLIREFLPEDEIETTQVG